MSNESKVRIYKTFMRSIIRYAVETFRSKQFMRNDEMITLRTIKELHCEIKYGAVK